MVKIVYFDEASALDYIDIEHEGRRETKRQNGTNTKGDLEADIEAGTPKILDMLVKANGKVSGSAEAHRIVSNQITNTVLTDFFTTETKRSNFTLFEGYSLRIPKDSATYAKTLAPVMAALKGDFSLELSEQEVDLEISKIGNMISELKGYSEFIASNGSTQYIFRFNDKAFRNNYGLLDMTKMSMSLYGIRVGAINKSELALGSLYTQEVPLLDPQDAIDEISRENKDDVKKLEVYDILLSGIFSQDEE